MRPAATSPFAALGSESRAFVAPYGRPESLLFACPKRSNQEKGHPGFVQRSLRERCALRCSQSGSRRVRARARRSCAAAERAHPCARTCAPFPAGLLRYSARTTGGCAGKAFSRANAAFRDHASAKRGCGQDGRFVGPLPVGGRLEEKPAGTRARCARVFRQHTDVLSKNPASRTRTRRAGCPESGWPGVAFLLVTSLWPHKEK